VQGLFAFQIQGRRGSEAAEVNLSLLHGHHPESEHRVAGHGATGRATGTELGGATGTDCEAEAKSPRGPG
jgi:hypothetical protein